MSRRLQTSLMNPGGEFGEMPQFGDFNPPEVGDRLDLGFTEDPFESVGSPQVGPINPINQRLDQEAGKRRFEGPGGQSGFDGLPLQFDPANFRVNRGDFDRRFADALNASFLDSGRRQRREALNMLMSRARGEAPSAAEIQMRQGIDQAQAAQFAQAASQGFNPAAQRAAAFNAAQLGQGVAAQGAALRAQEQAQAQAALLQALNQQRAQDIQQMESRNRLRLGYEQLGFNRDQAEALARQEMEDFRLRQFLGMMGVNAENRRTDQQQTAAILNAISQAGAAALGSGLFGGGA